MWLTVCSHHKQPDKTGTGRFLPFLPLPLMRRIWGTVKYLRGQAKGFLKSHHIEMPYLMFPQWLLSWSIGNEDSLGPDRT